MKRIVHGMSMTWYCKIVY